MDYQKIIILGNTTRDAEVKRSKDSGNVYADLVVACTARKEGKPVYYPVRVFGKRAQSCERIKKGDRLLVEGSLEVSEFTDAEGQERRAFRVVADTYRHIQRAERSEQPADAQ